jgi:ribosomal protein L37AE/L43A
MKGPSSKASRPHHIVCPFCESGELVSVGPGSARCRSCGLPLLGSTLETLRDVVGLPDTLGTHACDCGHPETRELPDGVFHCPACGSEVLPVESGGRRPVFDTVLPPKGCTGSNSSGESSTLWIELALGEG